LLPLPPVTQINERGTVLDVKTACHQHLQASFNCTRLLHSQT